MARHVICMEVSQSCSHSFLLYIQAGLVLHDFALTQLENLHHFSNLCDNFRFNMMWHRLFVATLIFCRRLAESDITVLLSVTCMD
jgi:hypothetical protein